MSRKATERVREAQERLRIPAALRGMCTSFPLESGFMVQLVLPRGLSLREAERIKVFVDSLVVPWREDEKP